MSSRCVSSNIICIQLTPFQALSVSSPFSAYEIEIVTKFDKSAPPLRGRMSLPRDPRKTEEVVLVFAEGGKAVEAREAGAAFVGGEELIQKVSLGSASECRVGMGKSRGKDGSWWQKRVGSDSGFVLPERHRRGMFANGLDKPRSLFAFPV